MKILVIDGANFMHRARAGFNLGQFPIVFNFFRNLRALVEMHKPGRVYFVLEGHPQSRMEMMPSYKANRIIEEGTAKHVEMADFHRQKDLILKLLKESFPVAVSRHPRYEADDVIYNIIKRSSAAVEFIVASNDSDFIQLLNEFPNVRLYNPITKKFVEDVHPDYVSWKALRGDSSDNIPGIPGIGDKIAEELLNNPKRLTVLFENKEIADQFKLNYEMIKFHTWSDVVDEDGYSDAMHLEGWTGDADWGAIKTQFNDWEFKSITKDGTWEKYVQTFNDLLIK